MKTIPTLFIFLVMILSLSSHAQSLTSTGTIELGGEISYTSQTASVNRTPSYYSSGYGSETHNVFLFSPYAGVMIGQGFELGFVPAIVTSGSVTSLNLFLAPAFNVNTGSNVFPYFEGLIGYSSVDNSNTTGGLGIGITGGLKVVIGSSALFLFNVKYLHQSFEEEESYYSYYPPYYPTTTKTEIAINTVFAGMGFRIFIAPKSARTKP